MKEKNQLPAIAPEPQTIQEPTRSVGGFNSWTTKTYILWTLGLGVSGWCQEGPVIPSEDVRLEVYGGN